jgi:polyisoprenoid-binding protein YceI
MKRRTVSIAASLCALACARPERSSPESQAPQAPPSPSSASLQGTQLYELTGRNTSVSFVGSNHASSHEGRFERLSGSVELVDGDPTKSRVSLEIQVGSLSIEPPQLAEHLQSRDFFDARRFPSASFESTQIVAGASPGRYTLRGSLTLHGFSQPVVFPIEVQQAAGRLSVRGTLELNRQDFGVSYPGLPDDLIADRVQVKIAFAAPAA